MASADGRYQSLDAMRKAARTVTDLLTHTNLVGIEFAHIHTVLHRDGLDGAGGGKACFGTGAVWGYDRAVQAAEAAVRDLRQRA